MNTVRLIAPTAVLGIGFSYSSFQEALDQSPDFIGCDGGSTDWGPYHLGCGTSWAGYQQSRRDLEILINGARARRIPLLIGTAGFTGSEPGLQWLADMARDVARDNGHRFRMALIHSEPSRDWILSKLAAGKVRSLDGAPALTPETIECATRIVAMMGAEPFQDALAAGANVVLAGRASDAAIYASVPLARGIPAGSAWHLGKTVECGNAITEPVSAGAVVVGEAFDGGFRVWPAKEGVTSTVNRVAAHLLYENPSPYLLREPSGTLDTRAARYRQVDHRTVEVTGSRFSPADPYTVRLEGVSQVGYRSICLVGLRDPAVVSQIDDFTRRVKELVDKSAPRRFGLRPDDYYFGFRRYGYDAVLGRLEPNRRRPDGAQPYEIGLVIEAVAADQEIAHQLVSSSLPYVMHGVQLPGVKHSANGALAYAPSVLDTGPTYQWTIWHSVELDHPMEPLSLEIVEVGDE